MTYITKAALTHNTLHLNKSQKCPFILNYQQTRRHPIPSHEFYVKFSVMDNNTNLQLSNLCYRHYKNQNKGNFTDHTNNFENSITSQFQKDQFIP